MHDILDNQAHALKRCKLPLISTETDWKVNKCSVIMYLLSLQLSNSMLFLSIIKEVNLSHILHIAMSKGSDGQRHNFILWFVGWHRGREDHFRLWVGCGGGGLRCCFLGTSSPNMGCGGQVRFLVTGILVSPLNQHLDWYFPPSSPPSRSYATGGAERSQGQYIKKGFPKLSKQSGLLH